MDSDFDRTIFADKPAGISSFGVVSLVRGKMSREKREIELQTFFAKNPELAEKFREKIGGNFLKNFAKNPREFQIFREKFLNKNDAEISEISRKNLQNFALTKKIKVGHAGTLDPFATGLLIILTGKKTREQQNFMKKDKVYFAKFELGKISSTGDPEGEISETFREKNGKLFAKNRNEKLENLDENSAKNPGENPENPREKIREIPTKNEIEKIVRENFLGEISQIPPLFSAIKLDGKKAYEISRKNENGKISTEKMAEFREKFVKEKTRKVTIFSWEILDYKWPVLTSRIHVSSGTYIRSLAENLGEKIGTGAFCSELRREKIGKFDVKNAEKIADFAKK